MSRKQIDPRLRHALRQQEAAETALSLHAHLGVAADAGIPQRVEVLVRGEGDDFRGALENAGMNVRVFLQGPTPIASGSVRLDVLEDLANVPSVRQIEASRPLIDELDLSRAECRANVLHEDQPPVRGSGVIIGIVDSGIDFSHPDFRNSDGSTRILSVWDQGSAQPGGTVPFGREFSRAEIDAALQAEDPFQDVPHQDPGAHGTHVAGIACGNGRGEQSIVGMAPEAELIVVVPDKEPGLTLARSVRTFEAFNYIIDRANGRPVSINMSQGMNGGGHSGETVLEVALDMLARTPGVVIVKSAGNEQDQRIHAGGELTEGTTKVVELAVASNNRFADVIELWHDGRDEIDVAVRPPGGDLLPFNQPGNLQELTTPAGNLVVVESDLDADDTNDTRTTLIITRGDTAFIQPGTWKIHLRARTIGAEGRFDMWIERTDRRIPGEQSRFRLASNDPNCTISTPGTARRIITVGSFVTRPDGLSAPLGQISAFSSRGPTRYGIRKPDLSAPGERISAARSSHSEGNGLHVRIRGTSMAAPHVAGAAALVLEVRPELSCEQVKQVLSATTRREGAAAAVPDDTWGFGRLDAAAAVQRARQVRFPDITSLAIDSTVVSWQTDVETTGAVLFSTHRRQLQLGRAQGSRASLTPAHDHQIDLGSLPAGEYFLEVVAFDQDDFWTSDDNGGSLHRLEI